MPKLDGCLVLGLGNPFLGDDSIGHQVAERLDAYLAGFSAVSVQTTSYSGVRLLDLLAGYGWLILIDAVSTGLGAPGTLHAFNLSQLSENGLPISVHHISLPDLLDLGSGWGQSMPNRISLYGIEILPPQEFSKGLSPDIERALPQITQEILRREFPQVVLSSTDFGVCERRAWS